MVAAVTNGIFLA